MNTGLHSSDKAMNWHRKWTSWTQGK